MYVDRIRHDPLVLTCICLLCNVCIGTAATKKTADEKLTSKAAPPEPEDDDEDDDSHFRSMKSALSGMMKKLETHIQKTESALGDKLQRLDKDRDGVLNAEELAQAVMLVLKNHSSEEVEELFRTLDKDNDGKGV